MLQRRFFPLLLLVRVFSVLSTIRGDFEVTDGAIFTPLERKITLKLKTAARVRHNLGKILQRIPWTSYELSHSVKLLENYLKEGGSLVDCLEDLPALAFLPIDRQIAGIMRSMEDHLPKYLVPAASFVSRSIHGTDSIFDANDLYRPDLGPLKADLFEKISLRDLREAGLPSSYPKPMYTISGPWANILSDATAMVSFKTVAPRAGLIAHLLENLRIPSGLPETRESVVRVVEAILQHGDHEILELTTSLDPYEFVKNAIVNLDARNATLEAVTILRSRLKRPTLEDCPRISELQPFYRKDRINYTLLVERDDDLRKSRSGSAFLSLLKYGHVDAMALTIGFQPFEYSSWRDLLLAFVGRLRRENLSEVIENVYGDLLARSASKKWQLLRNGRTARTVFNDLATKSTIPRVKRIYGDLGSALERWKNPKEWRKTLAYGSYDSEEISGPLDATVKTLRTLLDAKILSPSAEANAKFLLDRQKILEEERSSCVDSLTAEFFNDVKTRHTDRTTGIDVTDLLQVVPALNVYSDEYRNLKSFLSNSQLLENLEIRVDVEKHPTRGRLLASLLQQIEYSPNAPGKLRKLAQRIGDSVVYEGYGAAAVVFRST